MDKKRHAFFESLHQQYFPMVFQMCLGFVKGDYDVASDLSQEVFIIIWNKQDSFLGKSSYKTWIYRVTVNTCLQHIRKEKKKHYLSVSEIEQETPESQDSEEHEKKMALYKAIGQLKELDRLIIIMVLEGQSNYDIAEILGINEGNIRVRVHRIKNRLKKSLRHE